MKSRNIKRNEKKKVQRIEYREKIKKKKEIKKLVIEEINQELR